MRNLPIGFAPIAILIGVVIVLAAISGGYLWWQNNAKVATPKYEIASWKTYHDELSGLEFKYPQTWQTFDEDGTIHFRIGTNLVANFESGGVPSTYSWSYLYFVKKDDGYYGVSNYNGPQGGNGSAALGDKAEERNIAGRHFVVGKILFGEQRYRAAYLEATNDSVKSYFYLDVFTDRNTLENILSTFKFGK